MPFHTVAFTGLLGTGSLNDMPALQDDIVVVQNTHFLFQHNMQVLGAWAGSATLQEVQLNSPKLRQIAPSFLRPIQAGVLPVNRPLLDDYTWNPLTLNGLEEIQMLATSGIAMGTERFTGVLFVTDLFTPVPVGDLITLKGTSTTAAVANAWTTIPVTWSTALPIGTYACAWIEAFSTNMIAMRAIFDNQVWRPGTISTQLIGNQLNPGFYQGEYGMWGQFRTTNYPRIQVLCNAADASFTFYMRVIRQTIG